MHDFLHRNFNTHIAKKVKLRWRSAHKMAWDWRSRNGFLNLREYDLCVVVEEFVPNIVIMQLGTNDLTTISAVETGSAIEHLCRCVELN